MAEDRYVRWFSEFGIDDVASVGGKNASLGEMFRELTPLGIPVPNGFAVTGRHFGMPSPGPEAGPACTPSSTTSIRRT